MGLFDSTSTIHFEPPFYAAIGDLTAAIRNLTTIGALVVNDLSQLQAKMTELANKAAETNATLAGLAQHIIDLKASGDVQAGIDALVVEAQAILDAQTAAEDAADDQLPTP